MSFDALGIWQFDWWHQPEVECLNLKVGYQAIRAFHFFDARAGAHTGSSRLSIYISECIYECGIDEATRVLVGPARRRGCGNAHQVAVLMSSGHQDSKVGNAGHIVGLWSVLRAVNNVQVWQKAPPTYTSLKTPQIIRQKTCELTKKENKVTTLQVVPGQSLLDVKTAS